MRWTRFLKRKRDTTTKQKIQAPFYAQIPTEKCFKRKGWGECMWYDTCQSPEWCFSEQERREIAYQHRGDVIPGSGVDIEPKDFS